MTADERDPERTAPSLRAAVYTDYVYRRDGDRVFAERAFALFLARAGAELARLVVVGRLDPAPGRWHYRLPDTTEFVALPYYARLSAMREASITIVESLRRFWRVLEGVDVVWLLGPHPLAFAFAALARMRGRRVVLGVRQDMPRYVAMRHPGSRGLRLAAGALEHGFRALARSVPVIVVGPELARHYARARRMLELHVSLMREADVASPAMFEARRYDGALQLLSVGRLAAEKNPLLLADVLARLTQDADDGDWRLLICGEGPLEGELRERLRSLGVERRAELLGYLPIHGGLMDRYRAVNAFLHISWTEGMPQVLLEAFAAGTPVVATAVGGVPEAAGDAALLIPPGDADAAASALARLAAEPELRRDLVNRGIERVRGRTLEAESARVARFLADPDGSVPAG
jgi:glycosyltransferase involved in cell wall biosynthesis